MCIQTKDLIKKGVIFSFVIQYTYEYRVLFTPDRIWYETWIIHRVQIIERQPIKSKKMPQFYIVTLDCQKNMIHAHYFFLKMCPETLLFGSNTVIDFSTNIKTEIIREKMKKKKQKYVNSPLEYVLSQACLLFALLKYNHNYFFLQWMIFTAVWKLLLLVILFTKLILFFCFFSVIILNNKPCQVWVCLPTCIFGSNMLIVFLPFCTATLLFGQHFHMAVKSNDPWYEGYHFVVNFEN